MISFCFFFDQIVFPPLSLARSTLSNSRSRVDDSVHVGTDPTNRVDSMRWSKNTHRVPFPTSRTPVRRRRR